MCCLAFAFVFSKYSGGYVVLSCLLQESLVPSVSTTSRMARSN